MFSGSTSKMLIVGSGFSLEPRRARLATSPWGR